MQGPFKSRAKKVPIARSDLILPRKFLAIPRRGILLMHETVDMQGLDGEEEDAVANIILVVICISFCLSNPIQSFSTLSCPWP